MPMVGKQSWLPTLDVPPGPTRLRWCCIWLPPPRLAGRFRRPWDPLQLRRRRLEFVDRNALRLLKLVNALLDFSRIEEGRMRACFEPTDLETLTSELASNFRSLCEKAGLRLLID